MKIYLILLATMLFSFTQISGNVSYSENLDYSENVYPQKIFVSTDKDNYYANETIWFTVFVFNSNNNEPDSLSTNVYFDVINNKGDIVLSRILKLKNGVANGDVFIPDSVSDGNYMIAAYTEWMRELAGSAVFRKNIFIHNPEEENYITRNKLKNNRRFNNLREERKEKVIYQVFPESGNFVSGIENRLMLTVKNALGETLNFKATVFDQNNNIVGEFSKIIKGYGIINIKPEEGKSYHAEIVAGDDTERINIIAASPAGVILSLDITENNNILLKAKATDDFSIDEMNLTIYSGIKERYTKAVNPNEELLIKKANLHSGVHRALLTDVSGNFLAERLFYIYNDDIIDIKLAEEPINENKNLLIPISFFVGESKTNISGDLSASVFYLSGCEDIEKMTARKNIVENVLIASNIVNTLNLPQDLDVTNINHFDKINLLLIPAVWSWNYGQDYIESRFTSNDSVFPSSLVLSGKVSSTEEQRISREVFSVSIFDDNKERKRTDVVKGKFRFDDLHYEGPFKLSLQLHDTRYIGRAVDVSVNLNPYPDIPFNLNQFTKNQQITERGPDWRRKTPWYKRIFSSSGSPPAKRSDTYMNPDQTIYMDDVVHQNYRNMQEVLMTQIAGLRVDERGRIVLRGPGSITLSNEPLFIIDGTVVGSAHFFTMNVHSIERIAVFKGPSASIFGSRGANGVIAAYTRRSHDSGLTSMEFELTGYHVYEGFEPYEIKEITPCKTVHFEYIRVNNDNKAIINATSGLPAGEYMIIVQGIDINGNPGFGKIFFELD